MAGNVYSEYWLAREKATERMDELEHDIFLCKIKYKSGTEFVLKTRGELMLGGDFEDFIELPFKHKFKIKENAIRESYKFTEKLGKNVNWDRVTIRENGYNKTLHYKLCLI